jgi:hypothetical protein
MDEKLSKRKVLKPAKKGTIPLKLIRAAVKKISKDRLQQDVDAKTNSSSKIL